MAARDSAVLAELEAVIGYAATRRLVLRFGGARVPTSRAPDGDLALVLREAYEPFCRHYAGSEWLEIPLRLPADATAADRLVAHVASDAASGLSADQIAPRYGIHRRTVYRLLARQRRASRA